MYEYIESEKGLWEVGFYMTNGEFFSSSSYETQEKAQEIVEYINNCKMVSYDPEKI